MARLNEQQAKQIIMNAQMASYPARDVPLILKPLYGYVEDTEKEIVALKAENERLRAELISAKVEICDRCKPQLSENGIAQYCDCRQCRWRGSEESTCDT